MEHEGSWQFSQDPATSLHPEPDQSSPTPSYFITIHFNIILPSMLNLQRVFRHPHQNPVRMSPLPYTWQSV
jgi:catechol-2,3-dioxygenase